MKRLPSASEELQHLQLEYRRVRERERLAPKDPRLVDLQPKLVAARAAGDADVIAKLRAEWQLIKSEGRAESLGLLREIHRLRPKRKRSRARRP